MSKNYFGGKPSSWKDNFESMRQQSEKIRKIAGLEDDIEASLSQEGRDYIEMLGDVVKITPDDYKDAMRLSALKHGRMRAEEDNRIRVRSSSKVKKLNLNIKHNPASTASRISVILKEFGEGLHIEGIIVELAKRNQLPQSVYHRYSHISKVLNSNYLLFEKIGPATFKSRSVLPWLKDDAPKQAKTKPKTTVSPSFKDLILWAAKKWAKRLGNSPRNITDALNLAGIDVAYDTVKKVLLANKETL
jgi:hypothetical protein